MAKAEDMEGILAKSQKLKQDANYVGASSILLNALDSLKESQGSQDNQIMVFISLAEINRAALQFNLGLEYSYGGLTRAQKSKNQELKAWLYNRMSAIHFELANNDSARYYANQSLNSLKERIKVSTKYRWIVPSSGLLLAAVERSDGNYQAALTSLNELLTVVEKDTSYKSQLPSIYFNYATTYDLLDDLQRAVEYAEKGYEYASQQKNYPMMRQTGGLLCKVYDQLNDHKAASYWLGKTYMVANKIHYIKDIDALKEQILEYEFKDKQKANQLLAADLKQEQLQNKVFIGLAILFVILGGAIFVLYRNSRKVNAKLSQQKELIEKQAKELMVLDEAKSRFFANISHELKTPLSLILGPLDQLVHHENLSQHSMGPALLAMNNAFRLKELVEEILDITKLDSNKLELKPAPLFVKKFMYRLFHSFQSLAKSKGQSMTIKESLDDHLCLSIDKDKFEKVISNLLSNAVKYTPEGGFIELGIDYEESVLSVTVKDDGMGMAPDDVKRVFDRFYQGETHAKEGGLGIGLALSKEYALLMEGDITAEAEKNVGSIFHFWVKAETLAHVFDETSVELIEQATLLESLAQHKNASILLAEDNHEMRSFIKSILVPTFTVLEAPNGKKALQLLETKHVDMIISDIMMPEIDGLEFLEKVKSDVQKNSLPFIMITAKSDIETKLDALRAGVDDYLQKPFLASELLARVSNVLQNAHLRSSKSNSESLNESPTLKESFTQNAKKIILQNLKSDLLDIPFLADEMAMSERTLFRSLKTHTGLTPNNFIKEIKLGHARQLLERGTHASVSEIAHASGFKSRTTFATQFVKRFGKRPSDYFHLS